MLWKSGRLTLARYSLPMDFVMDVKGGGEASVLFAGTRAYTRGKPLFMQRPNCPLKETLFHEYL
jgi:hypothetical protein